MLLLDGKATAAAIRAEIAERVRELAPKSGRVPGLAVILVGDDPASQVYVRNKERDCHEVGFHSEIFRLPDHITREALLSHIDALNERADIDGVLLQLPLPSGLDSQLCLERIRPDKDVDGFHPVNVGKLTLGLPGLRSCTPAGIMLLLERYGLSPAGKRAVVIGRSNIVGKPLSIMLGAPGPQANATVTVCHSGTPNLEDICREADFLFVAMGKPKFVHAGMVKPGAVVVDVGIHTTDAGLCGDCDFAAVSPVASAMTPVPGGIGPMTRAQLLKNTMQAFEAHVG